MCGITAVSSRSTDRCITKELIQGIQQLLNRGYDSCGALLIGVNRDPWCFKCASSSTNTTDAFERLQQQSPTSHGFHTGIAHSRWRTSGGQTDNNAHPHASQNQRFYVVHNGIITNFTEIKAKLLKKHYNFVSETDTEVIPMLMQECYANISLEGGVDSDSVFTAWQLVIKELEGTWALVMCDVQQPNALYIAKQGSPLLWAYSDDKDIIGFASEIAGLQFPLNNRQQITSLVDGQIMSVKSCQGEWILKTTEIKKSVSVLRSFQDDFIVQNTAQTIPHSPHPFQYWTEKEICEQPDKLWAALNCGGRLFYAHDHWCIKLGGLEHCQNRLLSCRHLLLLGCGSSYHAALMALPLFRKLNTFVTVQAMDASEFTLDDLPQEQEIVVIVVSQSGETKDVHKVMEMIKYDTIIIGVVNVPGSLIARESDCGSYLNIGREVGVAATKSFSASTLVLGVIALWFAQNRQHFAIDRWALQLYQTPNLFRQYMPIVQHWVESLLKNTTYNIFEALDLYIVATGCALPVAMEAALKIKELCYLHAEAFGAASMKHGTFALIDPVKRTHVIVNIWMGSHQNKMLSVTNQVRARGARIVIITNDTNMAAQSDELCFLLDEPNEWNATFVSILFYQCLAFQLALEHGYNPDFPRNLCKTVTV